MHPMNKTRNRKGIFQLSTTENKTESSTVFLFCWPFSKRLVLWYTKACNIEVNPQTFTDIAKTETGLFWFPCLRKAFSFTVFY